MPFHRSTPDCHISFGSSLQQAVQRQQLNAISSYIDASLVYGHTPQLQSFLRDLSGLNGKLTVNDQFKDPNRRAYLPFVAKKPSLCRTDQQGERVECFSAGDSRVNEGLPLIALHTLWLREHNRIAEALKHINGHWSPETIYQETRKIIGALHQVCDLRPMPEMMLIHTFSHVFNLHVKEKKLWFRASTSLTRDVQIRDKNRKPLMHLHVYICSLVHYC